MNLKFLFFVLSFSALFSCTPAKMEVKSRGVVLSDNVVIHYLEAGQGPVLVMIHGFGSSDSWRPSMDRLAKTYQVIAPDLPGFGKSDKPRVDYSVEYQAAALEKFIDALGLKKVAVAGHSFGGWIAAIAALNRPEKIERLILVDSAGLRREGPSPVNLNPGSKEELRALLLSLYADKSLVSERLVRDQWEYRREIRGTVQAMLDSLKTRRPLLDERLKNIKVPTLIIWGKQDVLTPLDLAERFAKGIPGSKLAVINDAGHMPQVERPREFSQAVKGFVRSW